MTTQILLEQTLDELVTLGWASDVTDESDESKRWEVRSPNSNMVDVELCLVPAYEGDFVGVRVSYLGEEYMEVFAELADSEATREGLLAALHGAALKDAELKALGK